MTKLNKIDENWDVIEQKINNMTKMIKLQKNRDRIRNVKNICTHGYSRIIRDR